MQRYWIPAHVHLRVLADIVWFDEKTNKYLTVDGAASAVLAQVVDGWPVVEGARVASQVTNERGEGLLNGLVAKGLLSDQLGQGRRYAALSDDGLDSALEVDCRVRPTRLGWRQVVRVASAFARAVLMLRLFGLRYAIAFVEVRKQNCSVRQQVEPDTVVELVSAFQIARLFFYSPKQECLFDSLVLTLYLCGYGIPPKMVFGVVARPFRAHCWDEWGNYILNGGAEAARRHHRIRQI